MYRWPHSFSCFPGQIRQGGSIVFIVTVNFPQTSKSRIKHHFCGTSLNIFLLYLIQQSNMIPRRNKKVDCIAILTGIITNVSDMFPIKAKVSHCTLQTTPTGTLLMKKEEVYFQHFATNKCLGVIRLFVVFLFVGLKIWKKDFTRHIKLYKIH